MDAVMGAEEAERFLDPGFRRDDSGAVTRVCHCFAGATPYGLGMTISPAWFQTRSSSR
jgi:hypothetical protein